MGSIRGHKCAVGDHKLQGDGVIVNNKHHIDFIRKVHADYVPSYAICENCYKGIIIIYKDKYRRAVELHKRKSLTVSSLEYTQDSIDKLVSKTPRNPLFYSIVKGGGGEQRHELSSRTTLNTSNTSTSSHVCLVQANVNYAMYINSETSTQSTLDQGPTTSAAAAAVAAARRNRKLPAFLKHIVAEEDDDEYVPSPNALNGTRLPHIQPIPKRRQFVHANKDIMDIYLAGTTGG